MLQDPQVLGNDRNKPHCLMSDPISTMYFHNMSCDLSNKILFKPKEIKCDVTFGKEFNKFNNTDARMLDSIYHMTLKLITKQLNTSRFCHLLRDGIMDVIT